MVADPVALVEVEKLFLAWLPELRSRAWALNHRLPPCEREEAVAEAVAWAWGWMVAGAKDGRIVRMTPRTLAIYASKMFRAGRRFAGGCSIQDAMSERAQAEGRVAVCSLDARVRKDDEAAHGFGALRPQRTPKPYDVARVNVDYDLVAHSPALGARGQEVFLRLVTDHDHGCFSRIARALHISPPYVHHIKQRLADALTDIGYNPHPAA